MAVKGVAIDPFADKKTKTRLILQTVINPRDREGFKNRLIDHCNWILIKDKISNAKRLLDFGCGSGRLASRVVGMGIDYTGIDASSYMINLARELNAPSVYNFVHFDNINIPFPDGSFDTCLSNGVLQYLIKGPDIHRILSEIHRVVTPGGHFIAQEQASLTDGASRSVRLASTDQSPTEFDYIDRLSKYFHIKSVRRVQSCRPSRLLKMSFKIARYLPWAFSLALNYLAKMEIERARKADDAYFSSIEYYDVLIEAVKR